MGFFALMIVAVSLVRLLSDNEFFRLTAMKRAWGRTRGLAMHFLGNVVLPMVAGIIFVTYGIVGFDPAVHQRESILTGVLHPAHFVRLVKSSPRPAPARSDTRSLELYLCP